MSFASLLLNNCSTVVFKTQLLCFTEFTLYPYQTLYYKKNKKHTKYIYQNIPKLDTSIRTHEYPPNLNMGITHLVTLSLMLSESKPSCIELYQINRTTKNARPVMIQCFLPIRFMYRINTLPYKKLHISLVFTCNLLYII